MTEMINSPTSVIFAGVGGQGVVLASELLALVAMRYGYDVKQTEVHGVAQRGGAVSSQVRFGERVYSPLAKGGEADILVALEKLEALRHAPLLKREGLIIANDHEIEPVRFPGDSRPYPHEALDFLRGKGFRVVALAATRRAFELGDHRMANSILLGVLSRFLEIPVEIWEETFKERIPERFLQPNLEAFSVGRSASA